MITIPGPRPRRSRRSRRLGLTVILTTFAGSALLASPASAAPRPVTVTVTQYETVFTSYGQTCIPADLSLQVQISQSGPAQVEFPAVPCGDASLFQVVSVDASCRTVIGTCRVRSAHVLTIITEPGNWAYWTHDIPIGGDAYVQAEVGGETLSNFVHVAV